MELTERKRQILKLVVEGYIRQAEPVGSKAIAAAMPGKVSSATIRNELARLRSQGPCRLGTGESGLVLG